LKKNKHPLKILFVYPNVTRAKSPQLGICMIAGVAHQLGHECDLYDLTTIPEGEEVTYFKSKLESYNPDILAVSCRSNEWSFVNKLFESIDVKNTLMVFGGPHSTVAPEEVIKIADIVVMGEGEDTFSEILKRVANGKKIDDIDGCWVKKENKIIKNKMRDLISDLDRLPIPYWKIFDNIHYYESYIKKLFGKSEVVGTFEFNRGCPYACTYCTNDYVRQLYKGKGKWRREKSPERIIQEMRLFRDKYGLDCVYFVDEVLLTNVDRLKKFQKLYTKKIGKPFVFMERPENMSDEKVKIIKKAGAKRVSIGIETGDESIRINKLNRLHSQKVIISAFRTAKKYGLITHAFIMVGFPSEDKTSIKKTYNLLAQAKPDTVQTTIFYPLKGTKLYEDVVGQGLFDPETPMPNEYYFTSHLKYSDKRKNDILRWQYILTNYKSRFTALFLITFPNNLVFRTFVFFRNLCQRK